MEEQVEERVECRECGDVAEAEATLCFACRRYEEHADNTYDAWRDREMERES